MSMTNTFKDNLKTRIRSGVVLIYIRTNEPIRAEENVKSVITEYVEEIKEEQGDNANFHYGYWNATKGWDVYDYQTETSGIISDTDHPLRSIQALEGFQRGIYVSLLGNLIFNDDGLEISQTLLNIYTGLKKGGVRFIIIAPTFTLPKNVENLFTLIEFSLPQRDELEVLFELNVSEVKELYDKHEEPIILPDEDVINECVDAALGLTLEEAENIFLFSFYKSPKKPRGWNSKIILKEKAQIIQQSGFLEYIDTTENFDNVGGLDVVKDYLRKRVKAFTPEAREYGLPYPRGIIISGPPRVGKSLTVKAISNEFNAPLIRFDPGKIMGAYLGEASRNVHTVIELVETIGRCVIWIDEMEKVMSGMSPGQITDSAGAEVSRTLGTFLTWLQERDTSKMIYVAATVNDVLSLPPELTGKGRFDELFWADFPSLKERQQILSIHLRKHNRGDQVSEEDLHRLAEMSNGFNGSELEEVIITALYDSFDNDKNFGVPYIEQAIEESTPMAVVRKEQLMAMRNWATEHRVRNASSETPVNLEQVTQRKLDKDATKSRRDTHI